MNKKSHQASDITHLIEALPAPRQVAVGILRMCVIGVLTMAVWRNTGLESVVTTAFKASSRLILKPLEKTTVEVSYVKSKDNPDVIQKQTKTIRQNIRPRLVSEYYYVFLVPLILFAFFPLGPPKPLAAKISIATGLMIVYLYVETVVHALVTFHDLADVKTVSKIIIAFSFVIMPACSSLAAHVICGKIADRRNRGKTQPEAKRRPVSKNAPCPCGSGKKYKRCCGAATKS